MALVKYSGWLSAGLWFKRVFASVFLPVSRFFLGFLKECNYVLSRHRCLYTNTITITHQMPSGKKVLSKYRGEVSHLPSLLNSWL